MTTRVVLVSLFVSASVLATGCAHAGGGNIAADRDLEVLIDSVMSETMARATIPGAAIVVVHEGRVVLSKGYGVADVESKRLVRIDSTGFRIGSVTKVLTALAVARLIDQGRIELDDAVNEYVPGLNLEGPDSEPIRVRHLLTHSGGFDQVGLRRQVDDPAQRLPIAEFVRRELRPIRPPGKVGVYDTYGMTLAGHLLERVTGSTYAEYMRREIFEPLGMKRSWVETPVDQRRLLATGYGLESGELEPQKYEWYVTLPASSVDATVADMGRLLTALLGDGGKLLNARLVRQIRSERLFAYGGMGAFTWGFWEEHRNGYRAIHHGGIMAGYASELYLIPAERFGLFVAYNRDPETGPPAPLRERVIDVVYEKLLPNRAVGRVFEHDSLVSTQRYEGVYGMTVACYTCEEGEGWPMSTVRVEAESSGLLSMHGGASRLAAIDSTTFLNRRTGRLVKFVLDEAGRTRYMVQGPTSFARLDEVLLDEVLGSQWREQPAHPLVARVYFARQEWQAAARAYESLTHRHPANGRYHFNQGYALLHRADFDAGEAAFRRALELGQWRAWSQYYIAAARAGSGDLDAAWAGLDRAIEMGFNDVNLLQTEPWWQQHASHARYRAALARIKSEDPSN